MENVTFDFKDVDFTKEDGLLDAVDTHEEKDIESEEVPEVETKDDSELVGEYLSIYDAMMFEDYFEKVFPLGKRYSCVIGTRSADADLSITRQLDTMNFQTMNAMSTMSALLTLSHSLKEINGKDLRDMKVQERYAYIKSISSHLVEVLSSHLVDFDILVREALSYGSENF